MDINMGGDWKYSQMETDIKDYMRTENQKAMEYIVGKTGQFIKGSLKTVSGMGMDLGHLGVSRMKETM